MIGNLLLVERAVWAVTSAAKKLLGTPVPNLFLPGWWSREENKVVEVNTLGVDVLCSVSHSPAKEIKDPVHLSVCGHSFSLSAGTTWLLEKPTCPDCRAPAQPPLLEGFLANRDNLAFVLMSVRSAHFMIGGWQARPSSSLAKTITLCAAKALVTYAQLNLYYRLYTNIWNGPGTEVFDPRNPVGTAAAAGAVFALGQALPVLSPDREIKSLVSLIATIGEGWMLYKLAPFIPALTPLFNRNQSS